MVTSWNKGLTKETDERVAQPWLGKKRPEMLGNTNGFKRGQIAWNRGLIGYKSGKEHYNWKGGISPINRRLKNSSMYKIWRELVFLRDNFTCQNPNCSYCHNEIGVFLHPHHSKPFALYPNLRFDVNNGITYCKEFHINSKELHKGILNKSLEVK